jgi:predicted SAM-dependent methyltransferase
MTSPPVRLNLACGQVPRDGFEGVDLWSGATHQMDLLKFPWKWASSSVDELYSAHFVEHIPMELTPSGQDLFLAFFDECWRILKNGGVMTVVCPNARSNRAFQDPTHRRFIVGETFMYLSDEWRTRFSWSSLAMSLGTMGWTST